MDERKGGWLSDATLERERKQIFYGMRNQYIKGSPPVSGRPREGVYSVTRPRQYLTREQARCYGKRGQPAEMSKTNIMTKIIQPKIAEVPAYDRVSRRSISRDDDDSPESWKHECQAGVEFWRNTDTGEVAVDPPETIARQDAILSASSSRQQDDSDIFGTGALVYDGQLYLDFTRLVAADADAAAAGEDDDDDHPGSSGPGSDVVVVERPLS